MPSSTWRTRPVRGPGDDRRPYSTRLSDLRRRRAPNGARFCESCGFDFASAWVAALTDPGLRRSRNEDAVRWYADEAHAIAVVCDGVAGAPCGDTAAAVAAEAALASLRGATVVGRPEAVVAVDAAMDAVVGIPGVFIGDDSPACTLVAAVQVPPLITVVSVGDSRAYWCGATGATEVLTVDDSYDEHRLTRWIGTDGLLGDVMPLQFEPAESGWLVLCTDGLWNVVPDVDEFGRLVARFGAGAPADLARGLVGEAIRRGGPDNVTVAVMRVNRGEES